MPRQTENQRRQAAGLLPIRDSNHTRFAVDLEDLAVERTPPEQQDAMARASKWSGSALKEDPGPLDDSPEEEIAWQIETTNRLRERAGLPPLTDEQIASHRKYAGLTPQ